MVKAAAKFNPDKIDVEDLAKAGGVPDDNE
jgi:hypothetical protein